METNTQCLQITKIQAKGNNLENFSVVSLYLCVLVHLEARCHSLGANYILGGGWRENRSSHGPGPFQTVSASPRDVPVSTFPKLGLNACATMPTFLHGFWGLELSLRLLY